MRLGLYRGNTQIPAIQEMLAATLEPMFLQPVASHLEQQLQNYALQWNNATSDQREQLRGPYYTTLKTYLMLCFPTRMDLTQATPLLSNNLARLLVNSGA